jgi:hypothetical protein
MTIWIASRIVGWLQRNFSLRRGSAQDRTEIAWTLRVTERPPSPRSLFGALGAHLPACPHRTQTQALPSQLAQGPLCSFSQTSHPSHQRSRVDEDAPIIQSESLLEWSLTVVSVCARVRAKVNRDLHGMNLTLTSLQRSTTLRKWVLDSNVITSPLCYSIRGPLACSNSLTGSRFWARCTLWLLHVRS